MSENMKTMERKKGMEGKKGKTQKRIDKKRIPFAQQLTVKEKSNIRKYTYALLYARKNYKWVYPVGFIGDECIPILGRIWEKEDGKLKFESRRSALHNLIIAMGYSKDVAYKTAVNPEVYVATRWGLLTVTPKTTRSAYYKPQENFWNIKDYFNHSAGKKLYMVLEDELGNKEEIRYEKGKKEEAAKSYITRNEKLNNLYMKRPKKDINMKYLTFLKRQYDVSFMEKEKNTGLYFHGTFNGKWILSDKFENTNELFDRLKRKRNKGNYVEVTMNSQHISEANEDNRLKFAKMKDGIYEARVYYPKHTSKNVAELIILIMIKINGGTIVNEARNGFHPEEIPIPYTYPEELKDLF